MSSFYRKWKANRFLTESVFVAAVLLLSVHPAQGQELSKLRDVAKATVEKQQPDWVRVSEREGENESRFSWKSGREGISVLIFIGKSGREAKERMDFTSNRLSVGPGKPRKDIGDEAYFWKDETSGMGGIRFRKGNVYIDINASSPAMAEDLAKRLVKEISSD